MVTFTEELKIIKSKVKTQIELYVSPDWSSAHENHRQLIREDIQKRFPDIVGEAILDLSTIPVLKKDFVSISHSSTLGGYAYSTETIGFDLIEKSRLDNKVLRRVCSSHEIDQAPNIAMLWPAKEAVFKASSNEYKVITEIKIWVWQQLGENLYSFNDRGFVFEKNSVLYGIYLR